jgi:hypothetical protein
MSSVSVAFAMADFLHSFAMRIISCSIMFFRYFLLVRFDVVPVYIKIRSRELRESLFLPQLCHIFPNQTPAQ